MSSLIARGVAASMWRSEERVAQFTVSDATAASESFDLVGTKASIQASPCFMFGPKTGIAYVETTDKGETTHRFDPAEQFGNET